LIAARVSLPSDRSFASYDEALAHLTGPRLPDGERVTWDAAMLDALFEYPIRSARSNFAVRLDFRRLASRVTTALRFVLPDGAIRAFEYAGDPGLIRLDPRWHQAALRFVKLGFLHILDGTDHLLFLLCLVIPFRRLRPLVLIVTSFTVAHSITLIASAFDLAPDGLWFPPLVETLIAMSILYMALENILGWRGPLHPAKRPPSQGPLRPAPGGAGGIGIRRRWIVTFVFGLVHGFGFSFALRESLQFAGSHLLTSLLSFNVGVEIGQLLVLALALPALQILFRYVVAERTGTIILSALVAHTAWHWLIERWKTLREYGWPPIADAASLAGAMRWLIVALVLGGLLWRVSAGRKRGHSTFRDVPQAKS
jgi:HupE/UreJ protein